MSDTSIEGDVALGFEAAGVIAYASRRSVRPGDELSVMVHCEDTQFEAVVVALRDAPGSSGAPHEEATIEHAVNGAYRGQRQVTRIGSCATARLPEAVSRGGLTLATWIWPTAPGNGRPQGILGLSGEQGGFAVGLDGAGGLGLFGWQGCETPRLVGRCAEAVVRARGWYLVGCSIGEDGADAELWIYGEPLVGAADDASVRLGGTAAVARERFSADVLTIGALRADHDSGLGVSTFNGKLEEPAVWDVAMDAAQRLRLARADGPGEAERAVVRWDLSRDMSRDRVTDEGEHGVELRLHNAPSRAVTGRHWTGEEHDWRLAPSHYAAVHLHDDDVDDAGWEPAFSLSVPATWEPGPYAVRLSSGGSTAYATFAVLPELRARAAVPPDRRRVALLLPTLTYLVYANTQHEATLAEELGTAGAVERDVLRFAREHLGPSLYDPHSDGSPTYLASTRRPILEFRPDIINWANQMPRHFSLDLGIWGWLKRVGVDAELITDEELDEHGVALLHDYDVVLTGNHPEYVTPRMLAALTRYVEDGGRLMYLGGNGLYWSCSRVEQRPHLLELRRGVGGSGGAPDSAIGEHHEACSGTLGGLWRFKSGAPHALLGVSTTACADVTGVGSTRNTGAGYKVTGDGPSWLRAILDDASDDEGVIGRRSSGLLGGAAADEIDRVDFEAGSPPNVQIVASSAGQHTVMLDYVKENFRLVPSRLTREDVEQNLRADMVYMEHGRGAVFSVGSVAWALGLLRDVPDGSVEAVTRGVLRHFLDAG